MLSLKNINNFRMYTTLVYFNILSIIGEYGSKFYIILKGEALILTPVVI